TLAPKTWLGLLAIVGALTACKAKAGSKADPNGAVSAAPSSSVAAPTLASAEAPASAAPSASAGPSASARAAILPGKIAPVSASEPCTVQRGPIQLAFTGAATVWVSDDAGPDQAPHIVFNRDGLPRPVTLPPPSPRPDTSAKVSPKGPGAKEGA